MKWNFVFYVLIFFLIFTILEIFLNILIRTNNSKITNNCKRLLKFKIVFKIKQLTMLFNYNQFENYFQKCQKILV